MSDEEQKTTPPDATNRPVDAPQDPETTSRDDGILIPREIVEKYRNAGGLKSRSSTRRKVRAELAAYHEARGWAEPTDAKVEELVSEIL